jgi:heterotetrameric sarcosine oxidase gamma subunit
MELKTLGELTQKSPLEKYAPVSSDAATIEITDCSSIQGLLHLRGSDSGTILRQAYIDAPLSPGEVFVVENGALVCLTEEEFILILPDVNDIRNTLEKIPHSSINHLTITDLTHGRGQIQVRGSHAKDLLLKLCGLDFSDRSFPNKSVAQTSFAKVHSILVRLDDNLSTPAYYLIMDRSLAAYVWEVIIDAADEFIVG